MAAADRRLTRSHAIVVSPAPPGIGGLGAASGQMMVGLQLQGLEVQYVTKPDEPRALARLASRRPLRRFRSLGAKLDRLAVRPGTRGEWDLAYAMPGFLPNRGKGQGRGLVLHSATHPPRYVKEAMRAARRRAGGGRSFAGERELDRLERELRLADVIRAESQSVAAELQDDPAIRGRVVYAPPGVDTERFRPRAKARELLVAFVGTFSLWKGIDILVDVAESLVGVGTVGTIGGPVCPWSRRVSRGAPFVPHDDVPDLLGSAHALVLPSATDGFAYVVLEAMASGAVPFVTPEVGAAEVVRTLDPRLVIPAEDFARSAVDLLLSLPLAQIGRDARGIAEGFTIPWMASAAARKVLDAI